MDNYEKAVRIFVRDCNKLDKETKDIVNGAYEKWKENHDNGDPACILWNYYNEKWNWINRMCKEDPHNIREILNQKATRNYYENVWIYNRKVVINNAV